MGIDYMCEDPLYLLTLQYKLVKCLIPTSDICHHFIILGGAKVMGVKYKVIVVGLYLFGQTLKIRHFIHILINSTM